MRNRYSCAPTALAACLVLAGCVDPGPACGYPASQAMLVAELYFGRLIPPAHAGEADGMVSDADWADFTRTVLTPAFPDGLTSLDADGQWRDPKTGVIVRDPTKLVIVAVLDSGQSRTALDGAMRQYRQRFSQQSVGLVLRRDCAAF